MNQPFLGHLTKAAQVSCKRLTSRKAQRGFTLIELMVTLTVATVLILIAVPSFRTITISNKLTTTANDVVAAINTARMEAIKRNANAQLCSNSASNNTSDTLGTGCGTTTGAVLVMTGTTATQARAGVAGLTDPLQLSGDMKALRFSGQGLAQAVGTTTPYTGPVADICTSAYLTNNHRLIAMAAGSILTTTTSSGACP